MNAKNTNAVARDSTVGKAFELPIDAPRHNTTCLGLSPCTPFGLHAWGTQVGTLTRQCAYSLKASRNAFSAGGVVGESTGININLNDSRMFSPIRCYGPSAKNLGYRYR